MNRIEATAVAIREVRTARALSQEQLALAAKLHRNVVGRIERNLTAPNLETLFALADALDVSAADLIARAEDIATE